MSFYNKYKITIINSALTTDQLQSLRGDIYYWLIGNNINPGSIQNGGNNTVNNPIYITYQKQSTTYELDKQALSLINTLNNDFSPRATLRITEEHFAYKSNKTTPMIKAMRKDRDAKIPSFLNVI